MVSDVLCGEAWSLVVMRRSSTSTCCVTTVTCWARSPRRPRCGRLLDELDAAALRKVARARAAVRARMWSRLSAEAGRAGGLTCGGPVGGCDTVEEGRYLVAYGLGRQVQGTADCQVVGVLGEQFEQVQLAFGEVGEGLAAPRWPVGGHGLRDAGPYLWGENHLAGGGGAHGAFDVGAAGAFDEEAGRAGR